MTSSISTNQTKPISIIFLDIDGVLIEQRTSLFALRVLYKLVTHIEMTHAQRRNIVSNYFSKQAIENLDNLIRRAGPVGNVVIVLSSHWRNRFTVDDLRKRVFAKVNFPNQIIDKTPDLDSFRKEQGLPPISTIAFQKYGLHLERNGKEVRGPEIEFWLRENQSKYNIRSFVILDDRDTDISARFPNNFVKIKKLLSESDVNQAYRILTETSYSPSRLPPVNCHRYFSWLPRF